jgi:hypothetical protein
VVEHKYIVKRQPVFKELRGLSNVKSRTAPTTNKPRSSSPREQGAFSGYAGQEFQIGAQGTGIVK